MGRRREAKASHYRGIGGRAQAPGRDKPHSDDGSGWRGYSVVKVQVTRFVRVGSMFSCKVRSIRLVQGREHVQPQGTIDSFRHGREHVHLQGTIDSFRQGRSVALPVRGDWRSGLRRPTPE